MYEFARWHRFTHWRTATLRSRIAPPAKVEREPVRKPDASTTDEPAGPSTGEPPEVRD